MFNFFVLKNDKQFQPLSHSVRPFCLFSTHNSWDSGNSSWKRCSHIILGNELRSMFCYMVIIEENLVSHISILKRYNNFKFALQQRWKLFAQSTPKLRKVTVAISGVSRAWQAWLVPGPALASAGPDWKHFCRAPHSGMSRNFEEGHQVITIEIISDVKERDPKKVMPKLGVWWHASQSNLSRRNFPYSFQRHVHNTQ